MEKSSAISVKIDGVTALASIVGSSDSLFLYAPGSSSNVHDPFGAFLSQFLTLQGISSIRFQFPYQEADKRSPDSAKVLKETWRSIIRWSRQYQLKTIIGGRSLGGKVASYVAAEDEEIDALALFAYPFHAPGRPALAQNEHLTHINLPIFFCTGTRDNFANADLATKTLSSLTQASFHSLENADHGFSPGKAATETKEQLWSQGAIAFVKWLESYALN